MSDTIKHECGLVYIRLLKPLHFYQNKYGTSRYGLHKMHQLMEKLINRGQDGAGVATLKLGMSPGVNYIDRLRSVKEKAPNDIFFQINRSFIEAKSKNPEHYDDANWQKSNIPFMGEVILGHLRYGTFGKNSVRNCHPFKRSNNSKARNLVVAGNFNLTNVGELIEHLGPSERELSDKSDTAVVMENIAYSLDRENERLFQKYEKEGLSKTEILKLIDTNIDVVKVLKDSSEKWDGGYVMGGITGNGDSFVIRDPNGIRPAYYYKNDEIVVVASERPVIQTVFDVDFNQVSELKPGHAAIVKQNGYFEEVIINEPKEKLSCVFERIYFSRWNDGDIYNERHCLGKNLAKNVLKAINFDLENTVFSFIPSTAEIAFEGLINGINEIFDEIKANELYSKTNHLGFDEIKDLLAKRPRVKKVISKEVKQRTFIAGDEGRESLVNTAYDICYGANIKNNDTLVVLDDSIVRGTTLKQNILNLLDRLNPQRIIIVSSAPQIRYPDCYGVDMSILNNFIAFKAAIELHKENDNQKLIDSTYEKALMELKKPTNQQENLLSAIYEDLDTDEITRKISQMLKPDNMKADLKIIFQNIDGLKNACTSSKGNWCFTGYYPTPGGNNVANRSFVNFIEKKTERPY